MAPPAPQDYNCLMKPLRPVLALVLLSCGPLAAPALDRVVFEQPVLDSRDSELVKIVDSVLERTRSTLAALHGDRLEVSGAAGAGYAVKTVVSRDAQSFTLVAILRRLKDDVEAPQLLWYAPPSDDLPLYLARGVFARWSLLSGSGPKPGGAPVFVDAFSPEDIRTTQYPYTPIGMAVQADGMLLAAFGTACWQLDRSLRIIGEPGSVIGERGNAAFAYGVMVTSAGSIILKPGAGKELYRLAPGSKEPTRLLVSTEVSTTFTAAAPDGSIVAVDMMGRRAFRIAGNRRFDLPLYASASHYINTFSVAPDGSIWVWDHMLPGFRVHAAEGAVADFVLPILEPSALPYPLAASVGPDGGFVMIGSGKLMRFSREGTLVWSLDRLAGAANEAMPQSAGLAVDWPRGLIYLCDTTGRRIVKLLDREMARRAGAENPFEEKLAALRAGRDADDPVSAVARARLYEEAGSFGVARAAWRRIADLDPSDTEAARRADALEVAELRRDGDELAARAIARLREVGIENARQIFQQALAKYELALARSPGDAETQRAARDLQKLFSDPGALKPSITIIEARLDELFPSMMQRYREQPVGTVTVKNTGAAALEGLVATVAPSVTPASWYGGPVPSRPSARIEPGASATLELRIALSERTLVENDEDLPLQVMVEIATAEGTVTAARSVPTTLHRRSALTWDETGRIAAFVTPNEETVSLFAARLAAVAADPKRRQLPAKLARAIGICEGLAAYGLSYVEDPSVPISKALGGSTVDTVRFARDTLLRKAGDCDDTTVLLASSLESAGIRTAVLTTPGHIFLAFDSGSSAETAAMLAAPPLELLLLEGTAWIPVETTVLKDGFAAAWSAASTLVRKHRESGLEVLPVHLLRDRWPALPLPKSSYAIAAPAAAVVSTRYDAAVAALDKAVYNVRLAELEAAAKGLSGTKELRVRMRQGILHALYGRYAEAEKVFRAAQKKDPAMVSPYVNIANLRIMAGDLDGAIATLREGLAKVSDPTMINLALSRCYADKGDAKNAASYLAEVKKTAPDIAAQYAVGPSGDSASGRGALSGGAGLLLWSSEQ